MNVVTIPKAISGAKDDLVVLPRKEYELLKARVIPEYSPTKAEIRELRAAEKRFSAGKVIPWEDVKRDLAARRRSRRS